MDTAKITLEPLPRQSSSPVFVGYLTSSPIGPMWVAVSDHGLVMVDWSSSPSDFSKQVEQRFQSRAIVDNLRAAEALSQLAAYLNGDLHQFTLPLDLAGMTPFQRQVLHLTIQIPYGHTLTYKEIALLSGNPNAARAVGRVEATNPIPLVIPCHRVIGSDGSLHGYGGPGGVKLKAWLLHLEKTSL